MKPVLGSASMKASRRWAWALGALLLACLGAASAQAADWAVVLMYHRFGVAETPSTSVRVEQFEAHIRILQSGGFTVMPLERIVASLRDGTPLPDRTVAITIDDAHRSVYDEAWPRLKRAGLPFTIFVNTDAVDRGLSNALTWSELRTLAAAGVTVGNHTASHGHQAGTDAAAGLADIAHAQSRLTAELGRPPQLLAYAFGEFDRALRDAVAGAGLGLTAAFGQHSGVAHGRADAFTLPRFALNEAYGSPERFTLVANTLPLPVSDLTPKDTLIDGPNPPAFGFTVAPEVDDLERLRCYASSGEIMLERLGKQRIEVRFAAPLPAGRSRVNCTLPERDGRWRWFGTQFLVR